MDRNRRVRNRLAWRIAVIAIVLAGGAPASASAYGTSGGYVAHTYAGGFPSMACCHIGPIGVAFDHSDNLYVADNADGNLYRFQPGGGTASGATRVTSGAIPGGVEGLAVSHSGQLFLARSKAGDVVELDPTTGQVLRTVVSGIRCATGLAVDPATGDLFVSQSTCGNVIWRVSGFENGPGTATPYASGLDDVDGLVVDRGGALYAAQGGWLLKIRQRPDLPPAITRIAFVSSIDGVALAAHPSSDGPPYLVANRNDGVATLVDFRHGSTTETNVFTGGTRGDFAAVDSHGCLYLTQSNSVVRATGPGGCSFQPTTPAGPLPRPGVMLDMLSGFGSGAGRKACVARRRIVFRLRQAGGVRLRSAVIYLNGRRVRKVAGRAVTGPITLINLPHGRITLKVVALTSRGRRFATRRVYANCSPPPRCVKSVALKVPQRRGASAVAATVYVNGRRFKAVRGGRITRVVIRSLPSGHLALKLVTRYSSGARGIRRQSLVGCPTA